MITQSYTLSLQPGGVPLRVPCVQGDTSSRDLQFQLTSNGTAASLPTDVTAVIEGTKPDGKSFSVSCLISGDTVTAPLTQQMTALSGDIPCQLTLSDTRSILGTAQFILAVAPAAIPADPDLSETELSALYNIRRDTLLAVNQMQAIQDSLSVTDWTPEVSGAASYDYRQGTCAQVGDLAIVTFAISGTFSSSADGDIVISGCPAHPATKSSGGGYLTGYFSADNLVFSGWAISSANYNITPVTQWATTSGTKYIGTAKQSADVTFEASGTIAFRIAS